MSVLSVDALVVGAGFGGIYLLKSMLDQHLKAVLIDHADDVGGTWFWNRFPGAMCDTEAYLYRYSWDQDDLDDEIWNTKYFYQPQVLKYLKRVADKYQLRQHMSFKTELTGADWNESKHLWVVQTAQGTTYHARYLLSSLGVLSKPALPDSPGLDTFAGEKYHTGTWPEGVSLRGKHVGVIGNGSTGVQVITEIAKDVEHLTSFQRNPQYSVPSRQRSITADERRQIAKDHDEIWKVNKDSRLFGFEFTEATRPTFSVDEAERQRLYEDVWQAGGGFRFMFGAFGDITFDEAANKTATDFVKRKITETVKDPEKARKLMPTQLYARRPLCDPGYYEQFNRDNVDIVSLKETPIEKFTPAGILTSDGKEHKLDVLVLATGFDAVEGSYSRLLIRGRNGESLKDYWSSNGPISYLGIGVRQFPNLFMVFGPNSPFANIPPAIETQVEFIAALIASVEGHGDKIGNVAVPPLVEAVSNAEAASAGGSPVIEATEEAERGWTETCEMISAPSLFRKTHSWVFGVNVPGKRHAVRFYFAGITAYRKALREIIQDGWKGFSISSA